MRFITFILFTLVAVNAFATETLEEKLAESGDPRLREAARNHVVDPYRVERVRSKAGYHEHCRKNELLVEEQLDCLKNATTAWQADYPDRGTKEYGDKNYSMLTKELALAKLEEMKGQMKTVSFTPEYKTKDVELIVGHLHGETMYIEQYVLKVKPRDYRPYK